MSDFGTLFGGGMTALWASGKSYRAGQYAVSPTSSHVYMRKTNGAGTTDPCTDKTNWQLVGPGGIKSIQRGTLAFGALASTVTATITAVDLAHSVLSTTGTAIVSATEADVDFMLVSVALTDSTTVTGTRRNPGGVTRQMLSAEWQVVEYWS